MVTFSRPERGSHLPLRSNYCSIDLPTGTGICPTLCPQMGKERAPALVHLKVPCEWQNAKLPWYQVFVVRRQNVWQRVAAKVRPEFRVESGVDDGVLVLGAVNRFLVFGLSIYTSVICYLVKLLLFSFATLPVGSNAILDAFDHDILVVVVLVSHTST